MAEVAGLVLGTLALAGTFKDCVECFSYFLSYKSHPRDVEILETKIEVEQALFLHWAHRVRLMQWDYDHRLDDPTTKSAVSRVLSSIHTLVSEASTLRERYGLRLEESSGEPRKSVMTRNRLDKLDHDFRALRIFTNQKPKPVSAKSKFRWVIADKEKFEKLVQDLSHLISKLNELLPCIDQGRKEDSMREMAFEDMASIMEPGTVKLIRNATCNGPEQIAEAAVSRLAELRILKHIWFRMMDDRREGVASPHFKTLEWALSPHSHDMKWDNLPSWLESGSGIYWLSGKAGSGKSTLMKYLHGHKRTRQFLSIWARDTGLIIGSFFFWYLGTTEQKSLDGLSRAILYQILEVEPSLIPILLPRMWKESQEYDKDKIDFPSPAELAGAFERLQQAPVRYHFCFFIDGLDEYAGNCQDGIKFIKNLCQNTRIKVMVSSRPISVCVDAFSSMSKLRLQDLTQSDISKYVHDTVGSHEYIRLLIESDASGMNEILKQVTDKAAGVFLWVVLACSSLLTGFAGYDSVEELNRRVEFLPEELDDMFRLMLHRVEHQYHEEMAKALWVCYIRQRDGGGSSVSKIQMVSWALLDSNNFNIQAATKSMPYSQGYIRPSHRSVEGRLRSRCGGLLEIVQTYDGLYSRYMRAMTNELVEGDHDGRLQYEIQFMHRTVFEFLQQPEVWNLDELQIRDPRFNVNAALSVMSLALARMPTASNIDGLGKVQEDFIADAMKFGSLVDLEDPELALTLLSIASELPYVWRFKRLSIIRTTYDSDTFLPMIAMELNFVNCAQFYFGRIKSHLSSQIPWLYYAILPWAERNSGKPLSSQKMVSFLLSAGCNPNQQLGTSGETVLTPWIFWSRLMKAMSVEEFFDSIEITQDFIQYNADINALEYDLKSLVLNFEISGISPAAEILRDKSAQLLDCIREEGEGSASIKSVPGSSKFCPAQKRALPSGNNEEPENTKKRRGAWGSP